MKHTLLYAIFFLLSLQSYSQADADVLKVRAILERQNEDWNRGDVDAFMKGYWESEQLQFIGKTGVTYGFQATLARYKKRYPDPEAMGQLTFDVISADKIAEEVIMVIGKWHLDRKAGELEGHFSLIWKNINGEWVIIADHSS
ncbi:nuclear transport factor 2 family protein [Flammeovirgaceae bacterium SG7u.111]|nr:nuclear transport factor 2 family protein [Flammeovirgaceae bacterium SG7u.132]WPO34040.1 nuclear transport factor 2 family protein [Flammeovirgaceae bacterium SG7u.111]